MKPFRTSALLALTGLLAVACSKQEEASDSAANPLLAYVPADTPYVFANLEPTPAGIVDAWLARMEPALAHAQTQLEAFQGDLESGHPEPDESFTAIAAAVLGELDGNLNRAGLEGMGISLESVNAVYGNGLFPVVRLGLKDAQALRDTIGRIETKSGQTIPEHHSGTRSYWKIENHNSDGFTAYIAILDDHVAFGTAPAATEGEFLPEFLGENLPAASIAGSGALARLNREKGFQAWGSGYLDLTRVADELLDPASRTAAWLNALGEYAPGDIDPVCAAEARSAASFAPRMVGGITELTADTVGLRYQLEVERSLAAELADLVADVPAAARDAGQVIAMALGIEVGSLREFLLEKAGALAAEPFQCPQLAELNRRISQAALSLNQPMPPFIGNLRGFRAVLEEIDPANPEPENMRGLFALEVASPQMVIGMASMFIPGFEDLDIQPGNEPVLIPQELASVVTPEVEVHAVMSSDAIGLSLGKGQKDQLTGFMELEGDNEGSFLSLEYDMAAIADLQSQHLQRWEGEGEEQAERMRAHADLAAIYTDMLGRTRVEFSFTGDGLVIDNRMTFR